MVLIWKFYVCYYIYLIMILNKYFDLLYGIEFSWKISFWNDKGLYEYVYIYDWEIYRCEFI